jgi:hypothetical protein
MCQNLLIEHFRGLTRLELSEFKRINLLVGRNNVGKTTFLEAFFLLSNLANPELPLRVNAFRGLTVASDAIWRSFFFGLDTSVPIRISGDYKTPSGRMPSSSDAEEVQRGVRAAPGAYRAMRVCSLVRFEQTARRACGSESRDRVVGYSDDVPSVACFVEYSRITSTLRSTHSAIKVSARFASCSR